MGKLFGTDGIRGVANKELSVDLAMEVAQAAGTVIKEKTGHKPRFVIGRDTRLSSSMLESAMAAGLCSVGCDVQLLGVVPTPAVAYLVRKMGADAGIMLTASHNPFMDNGIKIISGTGFKLSDEEEEEIEAIIIDNERVPQKAPPGRNRNGDRCVRCGGSIRGLSGQPGRGPLFRNEGGAGLCQRVCQRYGAEDF